MLTGLLSTVLPVSELVGRRVAPAVARLLPAAGCPSGLDLGGELGVAGLVAAFPGVEVGEVLLAAAPAIGRPAGRRAGGVGEGIAGRGKVAGGAPQGALGGSIVTDGRLERLAALRSRVVLAGADLRCRRGAPRSALRTATSAPRSSSLIWSRFELICTSSRWRSGAEIRGVVAFAGGSVLPGVVPGARFHSFSLVNGARTFWRLRRRRCVRASRTRWRRAWFGGVSDWTWALKCAVQSCRSAAVRRRPAVLPLYKADPGKEPRPHPPARLAAPEAKAAESGARATRAACRAVRGAWRPPNPRVGSGRHPADFLGCVASIGTTLARCISSCT